MIAMEPKNYNKFTYFILPFIIPDKTLLSKEFGFINSYSKTIVKKTTIILIFKYDLKNHNTLHEVLEALDNYKSCYLNMDYEMFEFNIPDNLEPIAIIALGYADMEKASPDRHSKARKAIEDFVYYETF